MIERVVLAFAALLFASPGELAAETCQERADWTQFFQRAGVEGTIVVVDLRAGGRCAPGA